MQRKGITEIYLCKVDLPDGELSAAAEELIPRARLSEILSGKNAAKQAQRLTAECVLRAAISEMTECDPKAVVVLKTELGKPFVSGENIEISISHTKTAVAVAISDCAVGVDVEYLRPVNLRAVERFFSEKEKEYVYSDSSDKTARFFEIWTRKEAVVKAKGTGFNVPFATVDAFDPKLHTVRLENTVLSVLCEKEYRIHKTDGITELLGILNADEKSVY